MENENTNVKNAIWQEIIKIKNGIIINKSVLHTLHYLVGKL